MDLFEQQHLDRIASEAPLADRMRPRTLEEFIGQHGIVGPGRLLRRAIQADQLSSLIFYGPPGTGKTTLARIIANTTQAQFIAINAVLSGVKEIREAIATAQQSRHHQRTILFIDEVHRFNKAQQDALLPWVENGTVILIGATTENPYFEVNKALVSRSRLFQLQSLEAEDLRGIVRQALATGDRGYGHLAIHLDDDAREHLVNIANGDARALLNALELAVETTAPDSAGVRQITLAVAEESIQQRAVLYDKEGDAHFDTISAFIKSVRGSDADAALYWLARMIYAGEDPRYIFRRLLILASEDIGLADPQAIVVVNACAAAFDRVGLPEGRYPLAQATLYLATTAKSNSVMGFFDALAAVEQEKTDDTPNHLKDPSRDKKGFGHGAGYLYPHSYREHWVEQQYLPASLQGQVFYQPSDQGHEAEIQTQVTRRREAQLAALVDGIGGAVPAMLSFGPVNSAQERWLQRSLSQAGEQLGQVRDQVFSRTAIQRHHVILDLNAGSGLLTWEAIRRVPEGGVYACVWQENDAIALAEQAAALPELNRPQILQTALAGLGDRLSGLDLRFDYILGRNALLRQADKGQLIPLWLQWLQPGGSLILAESVPRRTQRLYQWLSPDDLSAKLYKKLVKAEEAIYVQPDDPLVNWDVSDLTTLFAKLFANLSLTVDIAVETTATEIVFTPELLARWFAPQASPQPSYAMRLGLSDSELQPIRAGFARLLHQTLPWQGAIAYIQLTPSL
jgi:putative ATPase